MSNLIVRAEETPKTVVCVGTVERIQWAFASMTASAVAGLMGAQGAMAQTLSEQVTQGLNDRLPAAAAAGSGESMTTLVQFLLWVLAVVLVALCGYGVIEGINGRGWNKAFAAVVGSVAIAILVAVVLQATA
ncbi:hypothetical protein [Gloeobacter morelensis]|uniref:hypothetical protein n=1 Tax=Gloeobacter morelensis TaxID=2907343 RepID=UPI001E6540CF|nr:hypothetical protein [Gloeobacter morelensis]UFP97226.1 hypothetical protein ISF26_24195 [Gloeobacter morelensis MG652769]